MGAAPLPRPLEWPRVVFVLGKGGVGRSTVSTALATALARRGQRVLVFEWALSETVAPWFGLPPAGLDPQEVAHGLYVANFRLDDALRAFFVGHLRLGAFYRHVVDRGAVRRLVLAAPGIAETMFLGHVCWLTTLAETEAGLHFDHVIVDSPATGHGASLLDLSAAVTSMHTAGLLGAEIARVDRMMRDPAWTGALLVSLPEELSVAETLELAPRVTASLGRPPLAMIVNRSVSRLVRDEPNPAWLRELGHRVPAAVADDLRRVLDELLERFRFERQLETQLQGRTAFGALLLDDQLVGGVDAEPRAVVDALVPRLLDATAERAA